MNTPFIMPIDNFQQFKTIAEYYIQRDIEPHLAVLDRLRDKEYTKYLYLVKRIEMEKAANPLLLVCSDVNIPLYGSDYIEFETFYDQYIEPPKDIGFALNINSDLTGIK